VYLLSSGDNIPLVGWAVRTKNAIGKIRGLPIRRGAECETGADGRVGMTFIDNSRFSLGPNSQIALEKFTFNPTTQEGEFLTKIARGTLAVITGHIAHSAQDAMQVQTRTTILGVRGTSFLVQVKE
jgi:hypothetical protein